MLNKQDYLNELDKKVEQLQFNIETLRQRLDEAPKEIQQQYKEQIQNLQIKIGIVKEAQNQLQDAEESAWENLKNDLDVLWNDLLKTSEGFKTWIKSKML